MDTYGSTHVCCYTAAAVPLDELRHQLVDGFYVHNVHELSFFLF